jgi:predicted Zn-dependent peptidase
MNKSYYKAENGISIWFLSLPIETITIAINSLVGAINETDDELGYAHFIEHLMFSNTTNKTETEINEIIDSIGGYYNAITTFDNTVFYIKGNNIHSIKLLDIIMDIYFNCKFEDSMIDREKKIVLEELNSRELHPGNKTHKYVMNKIFSDRKKHPIIGTSDSINNINKDLLLKFKEKNYLNDKCCIIISGKFDEKLILEFIKQYLKTEIKSYVPIFSKYDKTANINLLNLDKNVNYIESKNEQTIVTLHYPGSSSLSEWQFHYNVLSQILTGFSSALLSKRLRNELGAVYNINSGLVEFKDNGYFIISFSCKSERCVECIIEILKIIMTLKDNEIDTLLLDKAKQTIKTSLLFEFEHMNSYHNKLIEACVTNTKPLEPSSISHYIDRVKLNTLFELTSKLFIKDNTMITIEGMQDFTSVIESYLEKEYK